MLFAGVSAPCFDYALFWWQNLRSTEQTWLHQKIPLTRTVFRCQVKIKLSIKEAKNPSLTGSKKVTWKVLSLPWDLWLVHPHSLTPRTALFHPIKNVYAEIGPFPRKGVDWLPVSPFWFLTSGCTKPWFLAAKCHSSKLLVRQPSTLLGHWE